MKTRSILSVLIGTIILAAMSVSLAGMPLPRSKPEALRISSQAVLEFVEEVDKINTLHSFMLVWHERVIAEGWWKPEGADRPHILNSVSKSFNATAVRIAIDESKLSLDDPGPKFFPAMAPADASDNLKAVKVRELLTYIWRPRHRAQIRQRGGRRSSSSWPVASSTSLASISSTTA